jgi:hypothetical protein
MIPSRTQCYRLWDTYNLPERKRIHVQLVARTALFFAHTLKKKQSNLIINHALLEAGCLLHDIDKNIPRLPGEMHPQTAVRVLSAEGFFEVAQLIQYHSVQYIEHHETEPKTWEEKLLFLSDKMVHQEVVTVEERFRLWWQDERISLAQKEMLTRVFPLVKALEHDICSLIGVLPEDMQQLVAKT